MNTIQARQKLFEVLINLYDDMLNVLATKTTHMVEIQASQQLLTSYREQISKAKNEETYVELFDTIMNSIPRTIAEIVLNELESKQQTTDDEQKIFMETLGQFNEAITHRAKISFVLLRLLLMVRTDLTEEENAQVEEIIEDIIQLAVAFQESNLFKQLPPELLISILQFAIGETDALTFARIALVSRAFYRLTTEPSLDKYRVLTHRDLTQQPKLAGESYKKYYQKHAKEFLIPLRKVTKDDQYLIFHAAENGLEQGLRLIFAKHTPNEIAEIVAITNSSGLTPIHIAAENGNPVALITLLSPLTPQKQKELILIGDNYGRTTIHLAAKGNHYAALAYLLSLLDKEVQQAQVQQADVYGKTPFHYAAEIGGLPTFTSLFTPLSVAEQKMQVLRPDGTGTTPIHYAASNGHHATLKFFFKLLYPAQQRQQVLHLNSHGSSTLQLAAESGSWETVAFLFNFLSAKEQKAQLLLRRNFDMTLLHCIALKGGKVAVAYLLELLPLEERKVQILSVNIENLTPVYYLTHSTDPDVLAYVCSFLTPEEIKKQFLCASLDGVFPIHNAAHAGNAAALAVILGALTVEEQKAQILRKDNRGQTPITLTAFKSPRALAFLFSILSPEEQKAQVLARDYNLIRIAITKPSYDTLAIFFACLNAAELAKVIGDEKIRTSLSPRKILSALPASILKESMRAQDELGKVINSIPELKQAYGRLHNQKTLAASTHIRTLFPQRRQNQIAPAATTQTYTIADKRK